MKYRIELTREDGKRVQLVANEYIDIDMFNGSKRIAAYTLREGEDGVQVYNENDLPVIPVDVDR